MDQYCGGNVPTFDVIATQTVRKADHLEPAFMHHPPKKVRGVKLADKRA